MRHKSVSTLTLDQAYQAAYLWMFHVGEPPVEIAERGTQSVELRSEGMAAFVRVPDRPLNQRTVLAVLATEPDHRIRVIFSTKGFTPAAISIAEAQGIALFSLDAEGSALPENGRGAEIAPSEAPPPPFPLGRTDEELKIAKANWGRTEFPEDEWIDCPGCGTNQHRTLEACRICGVPLAKAGTSDSAPANIVYQCLDCGSHNIDAVPTLDPARHV
ncbi:MAG: hypothetical protein WBN93_07525 [Acidimicrobiia bacterium]